MCLLFDLCLLDCFALCLVSCVCQLHADLELLWGCGYLFGLWCLLVLRFKIMYYLLLLILLRWFVLVVRLLLYLVCFVFCLICLVNLSFGL